MRELIENKFYDATKELPVVTATEVEDKRLKIYKWGEDNLYPNFLSTLAYSCAIHGGVIRSKVHYTVSAGLQYAGLSVADWNVFYKNGNSDFNLDELSEVLSSDLETFNGYAFTINFVNSRPFQLDHVPFEKLRKTIDGRWVMSEDWSDKKALLKYFKTLDLTERVGQQIVVYTEKPKQIKIGNKLTKGIYPVPPYSGGILAIETDIEINNYRRSEIYNNFSLGSIINFNNGQPATNDDKKDILNNVKNLGQGSANAGGVMATFNNGKDTETTVTSLTGNNLDARYLALSKDNKENILLAHSITSPILFGIKTEGQLGGANEAEVLYNLMKEGYFAYRQRAISSVLQFVFNKLWMKDGEITFKEVKLNSVEVVEEKQFTEEKDPIIAAFTTYGRTKDVSKIIASRPANIDNLEEEQFIKSYKTFEKVTDLQINVLNMIRQGNDFDTIKGTLNLSDSNLSKIYDNLQTEGYLSGESVTASGDRLLASNDKVKLSVAYSYEVRPELGQADVIPTTRDFCRELIGLNRVYTRQEIEQISGLVDRDVWRYRGGWYHDPNTDKNTPFCRHFWQQNIILE